MLLINCFLGSIIIAPSLLVKRDSVAVISLSIIFLFELGLFIRAVYARMIQPRKTALLKSWPASRGLLLTFAGVVAIYVLCVILYALVSQHATIQNVAYLNLLLQTMMVAHLGVPLLRWAFPKRAEYIGNADNMADILILLELVPRWLREIISSAVYIGLPMIMFFGDVGVLMSGTQLGTLKFISLALITHSAYLVAVIGVRVIVPYRT